jgi:hypothetical protein
MILEKNCLQGEIFVVIFGKIRHHPLRGSPFEWVINKSAAVIARTDHAFFGASNLFLV